MLSDKFASHAFFNPIFDTKSSLKNLDFSRKALKIEKPPAASSQKEKKAAHSAAKIFLLLEGASGFSTFSKFKY